MNPEKWKRVDSLFLKLLDLPKEARSDALEKETQADTEVREEVRSLLDSHDQASFLDKPVGTQLLEGALEVKALYLKKLTTGEIIDDYEIIRLLGKGAFANVYLARQRSLDRLVALKISPDMGNEAETMATLEHNKIVRVFSNKIDPERHARLVCMQYVAGAPLNTILSELGKGQRMESFIEVIDRLSPPNTSFNPNAIKDREYTARLTPIDTFLWIGKQLADALSYAHDRGVLHLDLKPSNILIDCYGRPYLTDFNISMDVNRPEAHLIGGTENYMSPEQSALLHQKPNSNKTKLDARSDIYSLGKVLDEAMSPLLDPDIDIDFHPSCKEIRRILDRCMETDPKRRFPSAQALANALQSCLKLRNIAKAMPKGGSLTQLAIRHPIPSTFLLLVLPQCLGSVVNIAYNYLRIVSRLTATQQAYFESLVLTYNSIVYPICIGLLWYAFLPVYRHLKAPSKNQDLKSLARVRKKALQYPNWIFIATTLGWMPGSILFPVLIHSQVAPVSGDIFIHFFLSFTLSWLIALTYSYLYGEWILLRGIYPQLCFGLHDIHHSATKELREIPQRIRLFHFLAGVIPLVGATILILIGPDDFGPTPYQTIRILVTLLIGLGIAGLLFAIRTTDVLSKTVSAFMGK